MEMTDRKVRKRNFGIAAHVDAGKTTLTERILLYAKRIHQTGEVHQGAATMDWMQQERERGITIQSAATNFDWVYNGETYSFDLIDTPGHIDFTIEVERSLRVLDGVILLLDSVEGVEPQTKTVWLQAQRHGIPAVIFVNKLDRVGADFYASLESLRSNFASSHFCPVIVPDRDDYHVLYDLVHLRTYRWSKGSHDYESEEGISEDYLPYRVRMLDILSEFSEEIMEAHMMEREVSTDTVLEQLRISTAKREIFPVLAGSALKNVGVQNLLNYVSELIPEPGSSDTNLMRGMVFKIQTLPNIGLVYYVRVYSGTLSKGDQVYNLTTGKRFRISRIMKIHVISMTDLQSAESGSIVAISGIECTTGDTLSSSPSAEKLYPIIKPEPVISISLGTRSNSSSEYERLIGVLKLMCLQDPSLHFETKDIGGVRQQIISGMGELHLQIIVDLIRTNHGIEVVASEPKVEYKTTLTGPREVSYVFKRQTGGSGLWAQVLVNYEPIDDRKTWDFEDKVVGGAISPELISAFREGTDYESRVGIHNLPPLTGFKATLLDGAMHPVDSKKKAFELAGRYALREAGQDNLVVLEPIMNLIVETHEDYIGKVTADIANRRGLVNEIVKSDGYVRVRSHVPLANLFRYVDQARALTSGNINVHYELSHYDKLPRDIEDRLFRSENKSK